MKITSLMLLPMMIILGCEKYDPAANTPECVANSIKDFSKNAWCDDIKIDEYSFHGGFVYCYDSGTCGSDMAAQVVDDECNVLGYLGGFSGNDIINGESFSSAQFIRTVWEP
jgi:hypothetical protein